VLSPDPNDPNPHPHAHHMRRRPAQLPALPIGYLVEVYAQARAGLADEGLDKAPGVDGENREHCLWQL